MPAGQSRTRCSRRRNSVTCFAGDAVIGAGNYRPCAPATAAPEGSFTVPVIEPVSCAQRDCAEHQDSNASQTAHEKFHSHASPRCARASARAGSIGSAVDIPSLAARARIPHGLCPCGLRPVTGLLKRMNSAFIWHHCQEKSETCSNYRKRFILLNCENAYGCEFEKRSAV